MYVIVLLPFFGGALLMATERKPVYSWSPTVGYEIKMHTDTTLLHNNKKTVLVADTK